MKDRLVVMLGVNGEDPREMSTQIGTALTERGVPFHVKTPDKLLRGATPGDRILRQLDIRETLDANDSTAKDQLYHDVAQVGLKTRRQQLTDNPHRLSSRSFTIGIADEFKWSYDSTNDLFQAMRSDVLLSQLGPDRDKTFEVFRNVAEQYLADYTVGYNPSPRALEIDQEWDRRTMRDFYGMMHGEDVPISGSGTWTPYEVELFSAFYESRLENPAGLSIYDRAVLVAERDGVPDHRTTQTLRTLTGIRYEEPATHTHLNALLQRVPFTSRNTSVYNGGYES